MSVRQKILKHKKIVLFLLVYLVFLSAVLYFFKFGNPPMNEVELYKGVCIGDVTGIIILSSAPAIKEAGVNIVKEKVPVFIDYEGNVRAFPYYKQVVMLNSKAAHRSGLQYSIELCTYYIGPDRPEDDIFVIPERVWSTFFSQYNKLVLEYADLAEKCGVEMFAPLSEGEGRLGFPILLEEESLRGYEKASDWGQEILHKIKQIYTGKTLWRSVMTEMGPEGNNKGGRWETYRDNVYINFTGYDYIGFTIYPWLIKNWEYGNPEAEDAYREWLREVLDYALMCAERDGCKGVIATEFGEERVFEEGEGKLSGYFFWFDEPDRIRYWYKERFP